MDVVILHGTRGCPEGNWFPWLKTELEQRGHTVYVPRFPTPEEQTKDSWSAALRDQAPVFGRDTVLIGHSLGANFMLHILELVQEPVARSIFVSPVMGPLGFPEFDTLNSSFLKREGFDWPKIASHAGVVSIYHGADDPYVPQSHAEFLKDCIGGTLDIVPGGGHLNAEAGYTKFPDILFEIETFSEGNAQ
ncbi:MAG: serine hydrolase family protein [Alphaproteobacteria bacterium]|nr:serine hydrolase family protein [Alphaproteobacteria bacterium]